ncbi:hypothetical protein POTOM_002256 [Populus tomentosa]|uniref:Phytosulfokine n=1 Tax=Populus tomentosa TaxID=118781 RepID=A0A8X8DJK4_POPTO|nr:hypothetical protein POTOM_002256 [Populus tomentosa]
MAYRLNTVCIIAVLLLSFTLTYAARPEPALLEKQQNGLQAKHRLHYSRSPPLLHIDLCCPAGASLACIVFDCLINIFFLLDLLKDNAEPETVKVEDGRDGVGEEECLMRRTLTAQTDYIYTQKQKP